MLPPTHLPPTAAGDTRGATPLTPSPHCHGSPPAGDGITDTSQNGGVSKTLILSVSGGHGLSRSGTSVRDSGCDTASVSRRLGGALLTFIASEIRDLTTILQLIDDAPYTLGGYLDDLVDTWSGRLASWVDDQLPVGGVRVTG